MSITDSGIRINKYLSDAGVCSRRQADRMIDEGRIMVNGTVPSPGYRLQKDDLVTVDGREIRPEEKKVLLLFNKPVGIVCSTVKQRQETTVIDYLNYPVRIYPVGRLDKDSEGLLLLTNQGELVNRIMKASEYHEKEYEVVVNKPLTEEFLTQMRSGVRILGQVTRNCRVTKTGDCSFRIILTQGLNRQIRRMCDALGYKVRSLRRIRIMNLTLNGIDTGKFREITPDEFTELKKNLSAGSGTGN